MIMPVGRQTGPESGKLTKEFFMNLPAGVFLASKVAHSPSEPSFAEYVAPLAERENQWRRIRATRADQRLCHVFKDEAAFRECWGKP